MFINLAKKYNIENLISKSNLVLDGNDSYDVFVFKQIVEASMKLGFWNGSVGLT